jgi:hypothetical protein
MSRITRVMFFLGGLGFFMLAYGFAFRQSFATSLWPWPDTPLSYLFIGSMAAAVGTPMIWIAAVNEPGALVGGTLNLSLISLGSTIYLLILFNQRRESVLLGLALASGFFFLFVLFVAWWSRRFRIQDLRPMPRMVKTSFMLFFAALLVAATLLVFRFPTVFPWPLNPDSSVIFGVIFYGNALYFLYGLIRPSWHNARGQLAAFLAYDLVLILPFLKHFAAVKPDHRLSLIIYFAVLLFSGGLAIFYLFLHKPTRSWAIQN